MVLKRNKRRLYSWTILDDIKYRNDSVLNDPNAGIMDKASRRLELSSKQGIGDRLLKKMIVG